MAVKRFQKVGVVQPEQIVEGSSRSSATSKAQSRLQKRGSLPTPPSPTSSKKRIGTSRVSSAPLFATSSEQSALDLQKRSYEDVITDDGTATGTGVAGGAVRRQNAGSKYQTSPESVNPWGGKSILAQAISKETISTISEALAEEPVVGSVSVFPQDLRLDVFQTVVRQPVGVSVQRWGGQVYAPLYWLDTEPAFEDPPPGRTTWHATTDENTTKWKYRQHSNPRWTLSVDGGLEWPLFI